MEKLPKSLQSLIDMVPQESATDIRLPNNPPHSDREIIDALEAEMARLKAMPMETLATTERKENIRQVRNWIISMPLAFWFFVAFLPWLFHPHDGYFMPNFRDDGTVGELFYHRKTWWGIGPETDHAVEFRNGNAYCEIDGKMEEIDARKFSSN